MVSWSSVAASKRQENRQKKPCFCKRYNEPLFVNMGVYFRNRQTADPLSLSAWLTLPRNGTFVSKDDSPDCHRSNRKGTRQTAYNEKMRKSAPALPLFGDIVRRNGLPLFLISSLSVCHPMPCPMRFSGSFP